MRGTTGGPHSPRDGDRTASPRGAQLKEDSHPGLAMDASFLSREMPVYRVLELKLATGACGCGELTDLF